jgi:iron complex outermembrane receptor protein
MHNLSLARHYSSLKLKDQTKNENQIYNLTYNHKDFFGNKVDAQIYTLPGATRASNGEKRVKKSR